MTISPEAKEAANQIAEELHAIGWKSPNDAQWDKLAEWLRQKQLATAPLEKEIARLRGEVEKAFTEGVEKGWQCGEHTSVGELYHRSRAKRVAEGRE